jgi:hypothetical protein
VSAIDERVAQAIERAATVTASDDALVQLCWLIDGLGHWYNTAGNVGNSPEAVKTAVLNRFVRASHSALPATD